MKPEDPMAKMREAHRESYERKLWIIKVENLTMKRL